MKTWVLMCETAGGKRLYVRNHVSYRDFKPFDDVTSDITRAALFNDDDVFSIFHSGVDGFDKVGYFKTPVRIMEADNGSY
jgi:hypothetical protein